MDWKLRLADFVATGFYSGRAKYAPGTCGTAVACLLSIIFFRQFPELNTFWATAVIALGLSAAGIAAAHVVWKAKIYGDDDDPGQIVIDEFAGYSVTLLGGLPVIHGASGYWYFLLAFTLFRVFDILKPPPIRRLENLPGGVGIVVDDLMAGVYALITRLLIQSLLFSANNS